MGRSRETNLIIFLFIFGKKSSRSRDRFVRLFLFVSFQGKISRRLLFFRVYFFFEQQEHSVTTKVEKFFAENRGRNAIWMQREKSPRRWKCKAAGRRDWFIRKFESRASLTWWLFHLRQNCCDDRLSALSFIPLSSTEVSIWLTSIRGEFSGDECNCRVGDSDAVCTLKPPGDSPFDVSMFTELSQLQLRSFAQAVCWLNQPASQTRSTRKSSNSNFSEIKKPETEISTSTFPTPSSFSFFCFGISGQTFGLQLSAHFARLSLNNFLAFLRLDDWLSRTTVLASSVLANGSANRLRTLLQTHWSLLPATHLWCLSFPVLLFLSFFLLPRVGRVSDVNVWNWKIT